MIEIITLFVFNYHFVTCFDIWW